MRQRSLLGPVSLVVAAVAVALALTEMAVSSSAGTPASYPSCGTYWNRNTPVSLAEQRANRCIVRAARVGRRARLVATVTTIEGDPIVHYVFVRGRRDVLIVVDTTRDAFGPRRWTRLACTGLVVSGRRLGWTGCRPSGTGRPVWLKPIRLRG